MVVIEVQLGLSLETSKKNLTTEDEIILIEEIFKYEGTLYGKMKGSEGGRGHCETKNVKLEDNRSNSYCRFLFKDEKLITVQKIP